MRNSAALILLALLLGSTVLTCIVHAMLTRLMRILRRSVAPQLVVLGIVLLGNIPILQLTSNLVFPELNGGLFAEACCIMYVLLTYNALGFCYFCVLNVSETSLHVHILMDLLLSGHLRGDELSTRYNVSAMIHARVERMIELGQLRNQSGRFVVNNRGLLIVGRIIHVWRRVLNLPLTPDQVSHGPAIGT